MKNSFEKEFRQKVLSEDEITAEKIIQLSITRAGSNDVRVILRVVSVHVNKQSDRMKSIGSCCVTRNTLS